MSTPWIPDHFFILTEYIANVKSYLKLFVVELNSTGSGTQVV